MNTFPRLRRRRVAALLGAALALGLAGCRPRTQARLLPEDYSSWKLSTAVRLDYPIPGHENRLRVPYVNPAGEAPAVSLEAGRGRLDYPPGTIFIKEIYEISAAGPAGTPAMLTAMVKAPEDRRARGGWLWVVKDSASGKENVMTNEFCFSCHANANESHPYGDKNAALEFRDYVFFPYSAGDAAPAEYRSDY